MVLLTAALALPSAFAQNGSLETAVRKALRAAPFRQVQTSVENGIVTLTGSVDRYQIKSQAEDEVSRVRGVGLIHDEIQVVTPAVSDRKLERNVEAAMAYSVFQQYGYLPDIHRILLVRARNGVLLLAGAVPSHRLAIQLFGVAARTKGVTAVVDRLRIAAISPILRNWPSVAPEMGTGISH